MFMQREINELEYLNYSMGQPYNLVVILRIKGKLTISLLEKAFVKAQKRHPLLKARLERNETKIPYLTTDGVGSMPIRVIKRQDESDAFKEFHKQLITPFNLDSKILPLFRVSLLTGDQSADLVLCCQHVVTDGMSMAFLIRDLIQYLNNPSEKIVVLDTPMKDVDIFTPEVRRSIPRTASRTKFMLFFLRIYHFLIFGLRKRDKKTDSKHDDIQIYSWTLTEKQTKDFLKKCKDRRISVHSAICTAFLPEISTINNPVDLRKRLNYPIGEAFGLYAGGTLVNAKYRRRKDFWTNTRRYQRKLIRSLRDRNVYRINRIMNKSLSLSTMQSFGQLFVDIASKQNPFAVTNLRSLDKLGITMESDKFSVISFNAAISNTLDAMTVVVFTLRKKMYFHYHYMETKHDLERIKQIAENAKRRIIES